MPDFTSSRNDMFGTIRFGDLTPADIAQVIDPSAIVPYHTQWSPPEPLPKRPSIVFGSIVVVRNSEQPVQSGLVSPVVIGLAAGTGLLTPVPSDSDISSTKNSGVPSLQPAVQAKDRPTSPAHVASRGSSSYVETRTDAQLDDEREQDAMTHSANETITPASPIKVNGSIPHELSPPSTISDISSPTTDVANGFTYEGIENIPRDSASSDRATTSPSRAITSPTKSMPSPAKISAPEEGQFTEAISPPKAAASEESIISTNELSPTSETPSDLTSAPAPVAPAAPKSWADLVKTNQTPTVPNGVPRKKSLPKSTKSKRSVSDIVNDLTVSYQGTLIHPRGLINNGNMCFMNAILQPLVHCAPFYNSLRKLAKEMTHSFKTKGSLLTAMLMFLNEFREDEPGKPLELTDGDDVNAFAPEYVYDSLRELKKIDSAKGRQEDAEEFLGFILDGLHEELIRLQKGQPAVTSNSQADGDAAWVEVGRNNKTITTRTTEIVESPISRIFSGQMRSILKCPGRKDSATLQPFQALQLDITPEKVYDIDDALINLTAPETLEGFTSPSKGNNGNAIKQNFLEKLPPILILHLKRFVYDNTKGTQKVHKHVAYPMAQKIKPEIMSPARRAASQYLEYRLFAVVYHHGRLAAGGHYTCDVLRQSGEWLRIDDASISICKPEDVIAEKKDRQAYMLFYCRA